MVIQGANHYDFTDLMLITPLAKILGSGKGLGSVRWVQNAAPSYDWSVFLIRFLDDFLDELQIQPTRLTPVSPARNWSGWKAAVTGRSATTRLNSTGCSKRFYLYIRLNSGRRRVMLQAVCFELAGRTRAGCLYVNWAASWFVGCAAWLPPSHSPRSTRGYPPQSAGRWSGIPWCG